MVRKGRNFVVLLFALLAVMPLWAQFAGGSGTESDPWLIATPAQLNAIRNYLGQAHADKHFKLVADIDIGLDNWGYWNPIGITTPFYGYLDGDTHIVSNMTVNNSSSGIVGLVGITNNATIRNLNLFNISVIIDQNYSYLEGGGLIAKCYASQIDNCDVSGNIVFSAAGNPVEFDVSYVGGLVGWTNPASNISNSTSTCSVSAYAQGYGIMSFMQVQNVGGLIGLNQGVVTNSIASGYCSAIIESGQLMFSHATGGLIGNNAGVVTNCHASSTVVGNEAVGGLIGLNTGQIHKCLYSGSVKGLSVMGGLVGTNSGAITDSYSVGSLLFHEGSYWYPEYWESYIIGGFLGSNTGTVSNCYSTGSIDWSWVEPQDYFGFVCENYGSVNFCYWDIDTSGETESAGGLGRTTLDMTYPYSDSTYVNWDFGNVWFTDTQSLINDGYPCLRWQYQDPTAYFTADTTSGYLPLAVQFSDESSQGTGAIQQWLWDFGDGNTSAVQNPYHSYLLPGTYTVSLTITNAYDSTSVMIKEQFINAIQPIAELTLTSPENLSFGSVFVEESSGYLPITIASTGGASVTITSVHFTGDPLHFELLDPFRDLVVEHGETDTLSVRFAPHAVGTISDTLYIVNDSVNEPLLKVKLTGTGLYVLPQSPQSPTITVDGDNINLSWDAVTLNMHDQPITPDYYFVYISDDPYEGFVLTALTPDLSYTHPLITIGAERTFYRISAVKFYRDDLAPNELDALLRSVLRIGMGETEVRAALTGLNSYDNDKRQ